MYPANKQKKHWAKCRLTSATFTVRGQTKSVRFAFVRGQGRVLCRFWNKIRWEFREGRYATFHSDYAAIMQTDRQLAKQLPVHLQHLALVSCGLTLRWFQTSVWWQTWRDEAHTLGQMARSSSSSSELKWFFVWYLVWFSCLVLVGWLPLIFLVWWFVVFFFLH